MARGTDPQNFFRNAGHLFALRRFRAYTLTLGFTSAVFFAFLGGAPHIMMDVLKRTPLEYGLWFITISAAYMAGNFLSGRYTIKFGMDRMVLAGCAVTVCGGFLCLVRRRTASSRPPPCSPHVARTFVQWPHHSQRTAGAISVDSRMTGAAAAGPLHPNAFGSIASQLGGSMQTGWPLAVFWFMAAASILALLTHWLALRRS